MAKSPRFVMCRNCNNLMPEKAKVCPSCGAKNKKPFYKKAWFVILAAILVLGVIGSIGRNIGRMGEKFEWSDFELGRVLPAPNSNVGQILSNSDDCLSVYVHRTSKDEYRAYVSNCQSEGYTLESDKSDTHYSAYNDAGFALDLWYNDSDDELHISLDAPMDMETIQWPTSELVSLLPVPKSAVGRISSESSERFFVYVGGTSLADYQAYVTECAANGFSIDYSKGEKFYYADHADGYHLSLKYAGNNVMSIEIEKAEEEKTKSIPSTSKPEATPKADEPPSASKSISATDAGKTTELVDGMHPEFKEAMDSYEAFYDEYCSFMKKYKESPTDLKLLAEYADMVSKLSDMNEKFDAWKNEDLNDAESKYYLKVTNRIAQKLLEAAE